MPLVPSEALTFLFTDVEGSTRLWEERPELMASALARHDELVNTLIRAHGGTVFSAMGDGVAASFERAMDAARAAMEIQGALAGEVWPDALGPLRVRMGLHSGEAEVRDASYFGSAVNRAARVMAIAWGGQVVCTTATASLLVDALELHDLGEHRLRDLSRPERVWQLGGPAMFPPLRSGSKLAGNVPARGGTATNAVALPARLSVRPAVGVVGRDTDIATILDAFKRAAASEGREVLLVSGEAGVGKTTLVAEAARTAFDAGARVLFGHCEEELATPYQLFAEALGNYVTHAPEDRLLAHVEVHGSELVRLVPALADRLPDLPPSKATDSDAERYLLFAAVVGLLVQVSSDEPVVLVLDDLQWADTASLQLLRHLIASEEPMRLFVLGTYRDSELPRSHPLLETLAALRRHDGVSRIELAGLDDMGVVAFMEAAAGHGLDDKAVGLAQAVYRETDGNPFFVSEVLRHLSETGAIYQDLTGRWVTEETLNQMALPDSVREVIGARVGRLGERAGRVLSFAAVIGRDFDLDLLAHATDTTEDALLDILDAAASVALVRELADTPGRCTFAHALIQHTLYEDLGPNRRARAHRRVAEALEDLCGDRPDARVGELARHWFNAAQPVDLAKAISYSRLAGDAALRALAPADALRYYAQALDLYPQATDTDPILGIDLAIGLGTAQRQTGNPDFRQTLLDAARRAADLGDTERLVAAALANDRGVISTVGIVDLDRVELLETALARLPADHPDRALVLAALCKELLFGSPLERRQALADAAIAIAQSSGDDATMVRVFDHISQALQVPPLVEQQLAWTADALARAERVGDPLLVYFAATRRATLAACAGDIDGMDRCFEIIRSSAEQLNQPTLNWLSTMGDAARALIAGDTDRAERLATDALQIGTDSSEPDAVTVFGAQLISVSFQRGALGDFAPTLEQSANDNPGVPAFVAVLAMAHAEADRTGDARRLLEEFASKGFDLPLDPLWATGMTSYADAAIECRDPKYAEPLLSRLAPWAHQLSYQAATTEGPISHFLGGLATVLGRYDEAEDYFAQSAAFSDRVGAKFFAARTDLLWGKMLAQRQVPGDIEKARELLTKAHTAAAANGYANVERRATKALQRLD